MQSKGMFFLLSDPLHFIGAALELPNIIKIKRFHTHPVIDIKTKLKAFIFPTTIS